MKTTLEYNVERILRTKHRLNNYQFLVSVVIIEYKAIFL